MGHDVLQPQDIVQSGFSRVSGSQTPEIKKHLLGTGGHNLSSGISSCILKSRHKSAWVSRLGGGLEIIQSRGGREDYLWEASS